MGMSPPKYFVGEEHVENFREMVQAWRKLSHSNMRCKINSFAINQEQHLRQNILLKSFRSIHRVPCQGYILYEKRRKLLPKYHDVPGKELARLRAQGVEFCEISTAPIAAYTGDTTFDVFSRTPDLCKVKLLIMEITFCDDRISPEKARRHGHIHIEDVAKESFLLQNEHILVMHLSARHNTKEMEKAIQKKLPRELANKMTVLPNEMIF